ncbi:MAG TPA: ATP-binding protein [Solirubrobacterales bacterium]|nr:ATP-binding protein [Solirubrobacterales bacterium]
MAPAKLMAMTTTDDRSGLKMSLPARAENVAVVRHALAGLGERLGMDETAIADLKTVVTEAAMNVVVHAYPDGDPGLLSVEALVEDGGLTVEVRDYGMGIRPRPDATRPSLRIGLTLIAALSSSFEISGGARRGTVIRMHLPISEIEEEDDDETASTTMAAHAAPAQTEVRVGPPELVGTVLSRVLSALAARQNVSVDRLSDTMLLADAISAGAPAGFSDGHVTLSIAERPEGVVLRVGPMVGGAGERLQASLEVPEVGSLAKLADEVRVDRDSEGEYLVVAIASLAD